MFRIGGLRGKCANGVGVRALLVLTGVLLGFGESLMAGGSMKAPDWETPHQITSDDGFAELRWTRDPSAVGGLYRLHEFIMIFFVREKRWGLEHDPEWNQSRWDIVDKIVETVQITPNPNN